MKKTKYAKTNPDNSPVTNIPVYKPNSIEIARYYTEDELYPMYCGIHKYNTEEEYQALSKKYGYRYWMDI
jgi:hypothetical protein